MRWYTISTRLIIAILFCLLTITSIDQLSIFKNIRAKTQESLVLGREGIKLSAQGEEQIKALRVVIKIAREAKALGAEVGKLGDEGFDRFVLDYNLGFYVSDLGNEGIGYTRTIVAATKAANAQFPYIVKKTADSKDMAAQQVAITKETYELSQHALANTKTIHSLLYYKNSAGEYLAFNIFQDRKKLRDQGIDPGPMQ